MDATNIILAIIAASGGIFTFALGVITVYKNARLQKAELDSKREREDRELDMKVHDAAVALLEPQTERITNLEQKLANLTKEAEHCMGTVRELTIQLEMKDREIQRLRSELDALAKQVNGKRKPTKTIKQE